MNTHPVLIEVLEARIAPAANLIGDIVSLSLPPGGITVPGDVIKIVFDVTNFGDTRAQSAGGATMGFYLSADTAPSASDVNVGAITGVPIDLEPLESKRLTGFFKMPNLNLPTPQVNAGNYHLELWVDATNVVSESSGSDNFSFSDPFAYAFQFGNVGVRKNVPLAIGGGGALKLTMTGAGTGQVAPDGTRLDMTFTGTDGTSMAKLTAKKGFGIEFDDITANSPLGSLDIFASNVRGDMFFNGGLGKLVAGAIDPAGVSGDDLALFIGGALGKSPVLDIFAIADVDLQSSLGIASLETHIWLDRNRATSPIHEDVIIAPFIQKLIVTPTPKKTGTVPIAPEFHADLYLTGDPSATYVLNDVKIIGPVMDATWYMADDPDLDVNTVRLDTAEDFKLVASGIVKQFHVSTWDNTGTSGPMFDASSVGTFKVPLVDAGGVGLVGDSIVLRGADSKGVAIKNFLVTKVALNQLSAANGGIENLFVGDWTMETPITAKWIKNLAAVRTLASVGDFAADVTLTGADAKGVGLSKVLIQSEATGDWTVAGDTKAVTISTTSDTFEFRGDDVAKFTVTGTFDGLLRGMLDTVKVGTLVGSIDGEGSLLGSIKAGAVDMASPKQITAAGTIESIEAKEWYRGDVTAGQILSFLINGNTRAGEGNLADSTITLKLAGGVTEVFRIAGRMENVNINVPSLDYGFENFSADSWNTGSLRAGWVNKMTFDGGGKPQNGFLLDVDINLYAFHIQNLASLGTLKVTGAVDADTRISLTHDARSVTVGAFLNSFFQSQTNVSSFLVNGIKGGAEPFFTRSEVRANQFGSVVVNDVDSGGTTQFGFFAQTLASYTRKDGGAVAFSQKNLAGVPGNFFDFVGPAYAVYIV